jgi:DNA-binding HxlR family transcriptional regulator
MAPDPEPERGCAITDLFRLLGKRHVPDILYRILQDDSVRFNTIQDDLALSPNTLSDRLKRLTEAGLVVRRAYNEIPPRVEYTATSKARELAKMFDILSQWADTHTLEPEAAATS